MAPLRCPALPSRRLHRRRPDRDRCRASVRRHGVGGMTAPKPARTMVGSASAAFIQRADGHVLLVHHAGTGYWVMPGGKTDDSPGGGETPRECCEREGREETGVTVTAAHVRHAPLRTPRPRGSWGTERRLLVPWSFRRVRLRLRPLRGLLLERRQRVSRVRSRRRRHLDGPPLRRLRLTGRLPLHRLHHRGKLRFRALVPVRARLPIRPLIAWKLRSHSSGRHAVFAGASARSLRTDRAYAENSRAR
ncbi:NUDIX domain-containing protein [Streptomyces xanthochromogenes]|uniref:NUDIX domain-containing protein n=1 Tax=Streptomyces xanthochromogenes TaxID=67384 RepID=UPI003817FD6C